MLKYRGTAQTVQKDHYPPQPVTFPNGVKGISGVVYREPIGYRPLTLDVYLSLATLQRPAQGFPLIMYIHRGALMGGDSHRSGPRFERTTCYRLAYGDSGVVRSDTLVNCESPQGVSQVWEFNEADIQLTDELYPVAREAMRRGYYMSNRGSVQCSRHQCPHWRRCEQDFGGVVEAPESSERSPH